MTERPSLASCKIQGAPGSRLQPAWVVLDPHGDPITFVCFDGERWLDYLGEVYDWTKD